MRVQEQAVRIVIGYMDQLDRARHRQIKQKGRIEELEEQVQTLQSNKEKMFSLMQQVMACRPPAHSYALFLHEQILLFFLESIYKEICHEIEDPI